MTDVLIVGGGGAGLAAAIAAAEAGATVTVTTKSYVTRAQTCMAQGGINAALGHGGEDSVEAHIADTLKSAQALADEAAVRRLCEAGIEAVQWLDRIGVPFSRTAGARIAQRRLGGASAARACYAQDYSGLKILHTLYDRCNRLGIHFLNERFLLDIAVEEGTACGAHLLNIRTGKVETRRARSVILATGGYAKVYGRFSTNAAGSVGDGHAAALRAGARLCDMEFVQFHPTGLCQSSILVSESARGAGGYLIDGNGDRFVDELLPRDRVARAIHEKIAAGEAVFLDIRHLGKAFIDEQLPQERKLARLYEGVDPVSELLPIRPAAHYTMGGIEVDVRCQTAVSGLFAVGECAHHRVHGANRLGGNSLLELIVFGREAGRSAAETAAEKGRIDSCAEYPGVASFFCDNAEVDFYTEQDTLARVLYEDVGLVRDATGLESAAKMLDRMCERLPVTGVRDRSKIYNTNLTDYLEFRNALVVARTLLASALARQESRGAHYRKDFPQRSAAFDKHSRIEIKEKPCVTFV